MSKIGLKIVIILMFSFVTDRFAFAQQLNAWESVLNSYADIALAVYTDSYNTATTLSESLQALANRPSKETVGKARLAWRAARVPYQQSEVFRFGNAIVDDWEGRVNAWPLDEGLIDYVDSSYGLPSQDNPMRNANVIASPSLKVSGRVIDTSKINAKLLTDVLHEADGVEANVTTGYHAIEFLLWGQDLNGTGPGAGTRPYTDFDTNDCSNKNCDRRVQYLLIVGELLVSDLAWMVEQWQDQGAARLSLLADERKGLATIITGMGSLSYGELAGERIKLGLTLHDPEEEHDCFSDNTHNSHFYNIKGIENVYLGRYQTLSGARVAGPSLASLLAKKAPKLDKKLRQTLTDSLASARELVISAERDGVAYDQLLAQGNTKGNAKVMAVVDTLLTQTLAIEKVSESLGLADIEFEGSDSLTSPNAVFK